MPQNGPLHYLVESNGVKLKVRDWQNGGKRPCVLIHGLAEGAFVWDDFAWRAASHQRRLVAVDLRGHGESDASPDGKYALSDMTQDVIGVIEQLHLGSCSLVGHSLGAVLALRIIESGLIDVDGVIIVDSGPRVNRDATLHLREQLLASFRSFCSIDAYASWLRDRRPLLAMPFLEAYAQSALAQNPDGTFWPRFDVKVADLLLEDSNENWWWHILRTIMQPVLIVRGAGSAVLPRSICDRMVKATKGGFQVTVAAAGHSVMTDNPVGFFQAVQDFLFSHIATDVFIA